MDRSLVTRPRSKSGLSVRSRDGLKFATGSLLTSGFLSDVSTQSLCIQLGASRQDRPWHSEQTHSVSPVNKLRYSRVRKP
jgi:hypothetical protein